jgi:hypothetical protein
MLCPATLPKFVITVIDSPHLLTVENVKVRATWVSTNSVVSSGDDTTASGPRTCTAADDPF